MKFFIHCNRRAQLGFAYKVISDQHAQALKVKKEKTVIVCLGNPPYDRHSAESGLGGWVRYGDSNSAALPILSDFIEPARAADVPRAIERAYHIAMTPPRGPTFVSVPIDDWDQPCGHRLHCGVIRHGRGSEVVTEPRA